MTQCFGAIFVGIGPVWKVISHCSKTKLNKLIQPTFAAHPVLMLGGLWEYKQETSQGFSP